MSALELELETRHDAVGVIGGDVATRDTLAVSPDRTPAARRAARYRTRQGR
jgi:hypothetical protein